MALGAERHGIVRLFVFESTLVSVIAGVIGLFLALWTVSIVPTLAGQNVPLESEIKLQWPVLIFHTRTIAHYGSSHGSLSGVAEFARRSRRWTQGGRARSEWQSRSTSFPSRFGRRTSWIIGRAAGRSRHADFQFCPAQPTGSGIQVGPNLGGRNWFCRPRNIPIPRHAHASRNDCRWNCRLLPAWRPPRSRTRSHSLEIVRRRRMHVSMEILCP